MHGSNKLPHLNWAHIDSLKAEAFIAFQHVQDQTTIQGRKKTQELRWCSVDSTNSSYPLNGIKASKKLVLIVMSNVYLDLILSVDRSFAWARSDDSCPKDGGLRVQTVQDRSEIAASPPFALIPSSVSAERELGKKIRLEGLTRQPSPCLGDRSEGEPLSLDRSDQTLSFYQSR